MILLVTEVFNTLEASTLNNTVAQTWTIGNAGASVPHGSWILMLSSCKGSKNTGVWYPSIDSIDIVSAADGTSRLDRLAAQRGSTAPDTNASAAYITEAAKVMTQVQIGDHIRAHMSTPGSLSGAQTTKRHIAVVAVSGVAEWNVDVTPPVEATGSDFYWSVDADAGAQGSGVAPIVTLPESSRYYTLQGGADQDLPGAVGFVASVLHGANAAPDLNVDSFSGENMLGRWTTGITDAAWDKTYGLFNSDFTLPGAGDITVQADIVGPSYPWSISVLAYLAPVPVLPTGPGIDVNHVMFRPKG